jgi:hypothetical protein
MLRPPRAKYAPLKPSPPAITNAANTVRAKDSQPSGVQGLQRRGPKTEGPLRQVVHPDSQACPVANRIGSMHKRVGPRASALGPPLLPSGRPKGRRSQLRPFAISTDESILPCGVTPARESVALMPDSHIGRSGNRGFSAPQECPER